jgi:AraC-like DNA-binding protein
LISTLTDSPTGPEKIKFSSNDFKIVAKDNIATESARAFHEEIEIKYFYDGNCALLIGSDIVLTTAGDITVVNPYEIHANVKLENLDKNDVKYYALIVGLDFLDGFNRYGLNLRELLLVKKLRFVNIIREDHRLETIILRVMEEMNKREEHYRLVVYNLMSEFFALLFRNYENKGNAQKFESENVKHVEVIAPALSKMHTDYAQKFTLEELAELCSVSKYHFCRIFKRAMNVTPVQYLTEYRVDLAEAMLKDAKKSISDVAWQCGFESPSFFTKIFQKYMGEPPSKYKKR